MTARRVVLLIAAALALAACRAPSDRTWIGERLRAEAAQDEGADAPARTAPQR